MNVTNYIKGEIQRLIRNFSARNSSGSRCNRECALYRIVPSKVRISSKNTIHVHVDSLAVARVKSFSKYSYDEEKQRSRHDVTQQQQQQRTKTSHYGGLNGTLGHKKRSRFQSINLQVWPENTRTTTNGVIVRSSAVASGSALASWPASWSPSGIISSRRWSMVSTRRLQQKKPP